MVNATFATLSRVTASVMRFDNRARLIAAILHLIATVFFGGIISILIAIGGNDALSILLSPESMARPFVIYMLIAGLFSLLVSILLFCPVSLSQPQRLALFVCTTVQTLTGIVFAPISVFATIVPLWFIFRYHRNANA